MYNSLRSLDPDLLADEVPAVLSPYVTLPWIKIDVALKLCLIVPLIEEMERFLQVLQVRILRSIPVKT